MMWRGLFSLEHRRRRLLRIAPPGPLRAYLEVQFADRDRDYRQTEFVALDLETTGLDARHDAILSVGLVTLRQGCIDLQSAGHHRVAVNRKVPERSVVIHQITDDESARGRPLEEVLPAVLSRLAGRVLLCHHAALELGFLDAACRRLYGSGFVIPVADTEQLIGRWLRRRGQTVPPAEMRLDALRQRFNLPRYRAHDALVDALATAELFCAFSAYRELGNDVRLRHFLTPA